MRIDIPFTSFYLPDWVRSIAVILDTETSSILPLAINEGSTIINFQILNPDPAELSPGDSTIRQLSGNEKMLLLYQWWITNDPTIQELPYHIISFSLYTAVANTGDNPDVVTLFEPSSEGPGLILQPHPDGSGYVDPGLYFEQTTLQITISVDDNASQQISNSFLAIGLTILLHILIY